ncbi:hypothetical protein IFM89_018641 [Coptis chinensis]|uniref:Cation/H(+) antiporter central domain-containing protein n=1 Tax=Coptis chinensis TaxID=261450 RepID=A0A835M044_9MAGN|nr:hypothetical protein IFM89_018641 [Coptis chinensis]
MATNPTKTSPVNLNIIHFVEIVGHKTPQIISHRSYERSSSSPNTASQRIVSVFRSYEEKNKGRVSVAPYTVVTSSTSMHNDACKLPIEKMISLIILPFHKHLDTSFAHSGIRTMNKNVLENAPCSVGIIIDRGVLGGVLDNSSSYHVAVVFLGGADDREALAYAERMSEHPNIKASKKALDPVAPIYKYCLISVSNILTTTCQYKALKYVSFPVQTLAKCAKMIPVMEDWELNGLSLELLVLFIDSEGEDTNGKNSEVVDVKEKNSEVVDAKGKKSKVARQYDTEVQEVHSVDEDKEWQSPKRKQRCKMKNGKEGKEGGCHSESGQQRVMANDDEVGRNAETEADKKRLLLMHGDNRFKHLIMRTDSNAVEQRETCRNASRGWCLRGYGAGFGLEN